MVNYGKIRYTRCQGSISFMTALYPTDRQQ